MRSSLLFIVIACCLAIPQASRSGNPQKPQAGLQPQMVVLNVRVTDPQGKAVVDVPESSFVVSENGLPQKIALFLNKEIPLSYGLLVDSSASLRSQFKAVINAAAKIINSNKPADETFVVSFVSSDKIHTVQETTSDKAALLNALQSIYVEEGQTAVVDAVYLSAEALAKTKSNAGDLRRKVLIVVTDGEDRHSYYKKEQLFQLLASNDIQIFIIAFTRELRESRDKAVKLLTSLATDTGGRVFFPSSAAELDRIASEIINDIRTQYVIGYVPSGEASKGVQKVQVSIADNPNHDKRVAVTRVGYSIR